MAGTTAEPRLPCCAATRPARRAASSTGPARTSRSRAPARASRGRTIATSRRGRTSQIARQISVVWVNLNTHLATGLKRYEAEYDRLTTIRLPVYAPDLNPVETVGHSCAEQWPTPLSTHPTTSTASLATSYAASNSDPIIIGGCITATRLAINPSAPP
ncbi:transposase [Streptomyces sp. NPDC086010]|uniref:transposase n=1 Tax=Streptomyces sp. NPDC086010 TaxID=3365745 RepID=UPI0037CF84CF